MRGQRGIRALPGRLLIAVALGALALLAIPAIGIGHNGHHHGNSDPAGTIKSFDPGTGLLTVDLTEGGEIAGLVTGRTHVRCDEDGDHRLDLRRHRRHGGRATASDSGRDGGDSGRDDDNSEPGHEGDEGGDDHADRPDDHGDDQGEADEPGEDHPGDDGDDPGRGDDRSDRCIAQLVEGAIVVRARLELTDGNAFFEKVAVLPPA